MVKVMRSSLLVSLLIHKAYDQAKADYPDSARLSSEADRSLAMLDAYRDLEALHKCGRQK